MLTLKKWIGVLLLQLLMSFNNFSEILSTTDIYEGGSCQWKGTSGICTVIEKCVTLHNYLITGKLYLDDIKRCPYNGTEMIACCTDPESIRLFYTKRARRSVSKSKKYTTVKPNNATNRENSNSNISHNSEIYDGIALRGTQRPADKACNEFKKMLTVTSRIANGQDAEYREFPHVVALGYGDEQLDWKCAGTLISRRYVLTAASCIVNTGIRPTIVRMGRDNVREIEHGYTDTLDVKVENITVHMDYYPNQGYNDIALIRLAKRIDWSPSYHPACLYTNTESLNINTNLTITGWGIKSVIEREPSDILQKAAIKLVPTDECSLKEFIRNDKRLPKGVIDSQLCAYDNLSDTCYGDGGAPLEIQSFTSVSSIVGITSLGLSCGTDTPGVYTRVTSHLDWIEFIVWPESE